MGIHQKSPTLALKPKHAMFHQSPFSFGSAVWAQCTKANTTVAWPADGSVIIGYEMLLYCETLKVTLPVTGNVISSRSVVELRTWPPAVPSLAGWWPCALANLRGWITARVCTAPSLLLR